MRRGPRVESLSYEIPTQSKVTKMDELVVRFRLVTPSGQRERRAGHHFLFKGAAFRAAIGGSGDMPAVKTQVGNRAYRSRELRLTSGGRVGQHACSLSLAIPRSWPNTAISRIVWNASQGMPLGSVVQCLSDSA